MRLGAVLLPPFAVLACLVGPEPAAAADSTPVTTSQDFEALCSQQAGDARLDGKRLVCADIAAIDQTLVYNRFGSFNPFGMIFALRRDLSTLDVPVLTKGGTVPAEEIGLPACEDDDGTKAGNAGANAGAGAVRLRDCKRPRPLTLRANVGDWVLVRVSNFLAEAPGPDFSSDFCGAAGGNDLGRAMTRDAVSEGTAYQTAVHNETSCPRIASGSAGDTEAGDWPVTRQVNFVVQGLMPVARAAGQSPDPACTGFGSVAPGSAFACLYQVTSEGTHFLASHAAPAGGEGDGGSITHGLFGGLLAERPGTRWYRSQVSQSAFDAAWAPGDGAVRHARDPDADLRYERVLAGVPVLNIARVVGTAADAEEQTGVDTAPVLELVHNDLNAIISCSVGAKTATDPTPAGCAYHDPGAAGAPGATVEPDFRAFREFTVFFHDELKTFYSRNFDDLGRFGQLAGVRDGFAINYGSSGMGALLLANRKGIGPAASCAECLYEEFFLSSWANGDPALLEWFDDDPSNVHHSYLNDPIVFRNFHAGPKETHVFHLHAHQWFAGNDPARGSYLDSQTVAPQQGFTYNIYRGGLPGVDDGGWWDGGSGNRNRTIGDSIFHCHLYPHFAQGMWELWRVHDVLEDGTRLLPDGQDHAGLSLDVVEPTRIAFKRTGSVDQETGAWLGADVSGTDPIEGAGTPVPALVPLPGEVLPPLPSYSTVSPMPGYPFYIAGRPGHRPPQAPKDIARNDEGAAGELLSGGLGRHVVGDDAVRALGVALPASLAATEAAALAIMQPAAQKRTDPARSTVEGLRSQLVAKALALGDMSGHLTSATIRTLDPDGEKLERAAMAFHADGMLGGVAMKLHDANGTEIDGQTTAAGGYASPRAPVPDLPASTPLPAARLFMVNGSPARPGAPFADPCGGAPGRQGTRPGVDPTTIPPPAASAPDDYQLDRDLFGFRRYKASAVQLDLIVNRAGWHDPQARINVLTERSDTYKAGTGRFSPTVSDSEEPFFFRALSGECIEFRHTNELPKDLELDDFQVRTPTDTIGQHIHLVKFDVTSSDGSGNGWNYEDGTLAPDEIMARRCAARAGGSTFDPAKGSREPTNAECAMKDIWRLPLSTNRDKFQTTVQRWFADPILTRDGNGTIVDRTMRTVFSHDHFGPSSIQQHGFYTALLIEPAIAARAEADPLAPAESQLLKICDETTHCADLSNIHSDPRVLATSDETLVGARKILQIKNFDDVPGQDNPYHKNTREFALSIADFAVLYDPRDRESIASLDAPEEKSGMAQLLCEAAPAGAGGVGAALAASMARCGGLESDRRNAWFAAEAHDTPPAWHAEGRPGDYSEHRAGLATGLISADDVKKLRDHLISFRMAAAGRPGDPAPGPNPPKGNMLAKPVAPPFRPESISVDHHDPYLVNYRNAPVPLRVGTKERDGSWSNDCRPFAMSRAGVRGETSEVEDALINGHFPECSFTYQRTADDDGDMSLAFSSWSERDEAFTRDPETPILEAYQGDRMIFRIIQGAQEVQHNFTLSGVAFRRNADQIFAQGMRDRSVTTPSPRASCTSAARHTRVWEYRAWLAGKHDAPGNPAWRDYETALANCDNVEGFTFSQEIGISEHFEVEARLRSDIGTYELRPDADRVPPPVARLIDPHVQGDPEIADTLFSFGSIDAIWNGAWGLTRVYRDPFVVDPATPDKLIGARLASLEEPQTVLPSAASTSEAAREAERTATTMSGTGCPLPDATGVSHTEYRQAFVAAVQTDDVPGWSGTPYLDRRSDPDGLMLALIEPSKLVSDFFFDAKAPPFTRQQALDAIAAAYKKRPEPFVMRVNAGDCVVLRYVNLLREIPRGGLRDDFGDAQMPRIAPLNVDPTRQVNLETGDATLSTTTSPITGLRPSAALGLSIALPTTELVRDLPRGFGRNRLPLPPATGGSVAVSDVFEFYAGRAVPREAADGTGIAVSLDAIDKGMSDRLDPALGLQSVELIPAFTDEERQPLLEIRGLGYGLHVILADGDADSGNNPQGFLLRSNDETGSLRWEDVAGERTAPFIEANVTARLVEVAQAVSLLEASRSIKWIPYAFGAVPLTATGDLVSHAPHGLIGVVDVVPANWNLSTAGVFGTVLPNPPPGYAAWMKTIASNGQAVGTMAWRDARPVMGFGAPVALRVPSDPLDPASPKRGLREAVLFFQDGLNLHDADSRLRWRWAGGGTRPIPRMVPDCPICDDSYDLGAQGVNYRSPAYVSLLRRAGRSAPGGSRLEVTTDLNTVTYPADIFAPADLSVVACKDDQMVLRAVHPGGRARQHAFTMNGYSYDDLFPGFGFPHSALVGPGKSVSAWLTPLAPEVPTRSLWMDGTAFLAAGGIWGAVVTRPAGSCEG